MVVFNRRNAFIGWLVIALAKPLAKQKARSAARKASGKRGIVAASVAAAGATAAGLMFWKKRRSEPGPSSES